MGGGLTMKIRQKYKKNSFLFAFNTNGWNFSRVYALHSL